jgi:hypothetical protein
MAVQFMNMPAAKYPDNAQLDLASLARPLFQGLNQYSQGVNNAAILDQDKQIGQTASTQGYGAAGKQALSLGRLDEGAKLAQAGQGQQDALRKRYGALAQQVDMEADPARRTAMWQGTLERMKREGAALGLQGEYDPEEMDPATGPKLFMAQAGLVNDPLEREKTQAEINRLNSQAASEGNNSYGKTGSVFQGQDGQFYTVQFAGDGTRKITPLDAGMTPARGTAVVGDQVYDKATGAPVRNVGANIAAGEAQKEIGTAAGKATASAPSDVTAADNALAIVESIRNDPAIDWGTGFSSYGNVIAGTPGYDFQNKVDQAKSGAFLTAIQQMRGLGALSNAEGDTATKAVTRANTATSKEAFIAAINDYEAIIKQGRERAMKRIQTPVADQVSGRTPAPAADGWIDVGGVRIREKR